MEKIAENAGHEVVLLENYADENALIANVTNVNALIVRSDKITKAVVEAAESLEIVVRAGAGYDNIDLEACTAKGITVMNTPGQNADAVAELALGMMVFQARGQFNGKPGTELKGKTLGIHAYGNVGRRVARIAKGFGMEVSAFDPFLEAETMTADGIKVYETEAELYANNQYVSLHIPATEKTKGSIGEQFLMSMPANATLVNTARKEVINEAELVKVMQQRNDFTYISDIAPDNKEEIAEKFEGRYFFTPKKMGAQTREANINAGVAATHQIVGFFEKGDTTFKVN
jgi:D-3-phosphoglycerate dehydrogenase